ncbi:RNA polymerase sigma factor [Paraburkholderia edwinii]|uniref:RNA polymerase sigma factor n=1 Tax=Paraburkholderia edwinii TaxID=2861782 RepID=A0ABX8UNH4_9BURK|nr:RNA polymerase sigma factor [Paraburkholderia edwinii]QYD70560.1 RNA polymerase sigma factor [Paraburkholderia edwinii]
MTETECDTAQRSARFQQMALPHLDAAFNLARWLCGNPNDAEDIVQDAYIRAFRYFDMFHGENARPWLLTIVRRTWYSEWQKREMSRHSVEFDENLDDTTFEGWSDSNADPETLMMRDQDTRLVHAALEQLPAEYREVMVLRELEELSYREIATIADLPVGTVMSRLARGRKRLAASLASMQARTSGAGGGSAPSRAAAGGAGSSSAAPGAGGRSARDKRCGAGAAGLSAAMPASSAASIPQGGAVPTPATLTNRTGERAPASFTSADPQDRMSGKTTEPPVRHPGNPGNTGATPGGIAQESPDGL